MSQADSPVRRRGYPLFSHFIVVTGAAVLAALAMPAVRAVADGKLALGTFLASMLASGSILLVLGAVLGGVHHGARGVLYGAVMGALLGGIAGIVALTPRAAAGRIFLLTLVGAALTVLMAAVVRSFDRRSNRTVSR